MSEQSTPSKFAVEISSIVVEKNVDYIDAVVEWSTREGIEIETISSWIKRDPFLLSKIREEAETLRIIKRTGARLPL